MTEVARPGRAARRLPRAERRAQLLSAARAVLARTGVDGFSLEEVAREAGVAASLPRHYFSSSERLLVVAVLDAVQQATAPLVAAEGDVQERLREWIDVLAADPWIHGIWMHSAGVHPEIDDAVRRRRRELVERAAGRPWSALSRADQLRGLGWIGACDAITAEWVADGAHDGTRLVAALTDVSRRMGLGVG
ncbi:MULTISPECIES: TetR/AcrR family transcriptional regulator [Solirubrobacterales]|uniref:TetR/AcrR family transcriptional regulator n=1 Tax=Solirubrobacterales TaxID=588673 RepID=UPI0012B7B14E|nr:MULTISPECIES: TetR/AcrR family transcriptional regulator [Solirubrobacterales]